MNSGFLKCNGWISPNHDREEAAMLHQRGRSLFDRLVVSSCVTAEVDQRASTENKGSSVIIKKCPTNRCTWAVSKINKLTKVVYIVVSHLDARCVSPHSSPASVSSFLATCAG